MSNDSRVTEFLLLGLSHYPQLQTELFALFLMIYLMTLLGNILIITAIGIDSRLKTPMYFFLGNLSVLEMCYTTVTVPNILSNLLRKTNSISSSACFAQAYIFTMCATTECNILTVMAYDRYVAICFPLRYTIIMSKWVCLSLAAGCWIIGFVNGIVQTFPMTLLPFCGPNGVDRLYCEIQPLLKLSCTDAYLNKILTSASASFFGVCCLLLILISYIYITIAILRIPSKEAKRKTFSTCASHITVVILYYGALVFMYLRPTSSSTHKADSVISTIYCIVIPVLNPIIYSLRNKEVKRALKTAIQRYILGTCKRTL
ncbi:olfactory receptor 1020-like [Microcaecilia unicolor]|uniref:Olfactory receptor n=1 Tax=Microcaecilia unicolor TaxID=1415580 RepID=A0A6P7YCE5_9AMPH|nr:olfactory receptor 1020-like [Microcaecilia unicolor]